MKLFKKTKKGFTLVELVVVIAVIAILAAVSVGAYFGVTESANNSKLEQEAKQVYTAIQTVALAPNNHSNLNASGLQIKDAKNFEKALEGNLGFDVALTDELKRDPSRPTIYFSDAAYSSALGEKTYRTFQYTLPGIANKAAVTDIITGECSATESNAVEEELRDNDKDHLTASVVISEYAATHSWEDSMQYSSINLDENVLISAVGGGNTGKYYTNGENWRIYQNESPTITISGGYNVVIKSVKISYISNTNGVLTYNSKNIESNIEVAINGREAVFGVGNSGNETKGQVRITSISVNYYSDLTVEEPITPPVEEVETVTSIEEALISEVGKRVELTGTVCEIYVPWDNSANTISFYITDENENKISVYCCSSSQEILLGDIVKVTGVIGIHNSKNQVSDNPSADVVGHDSSYDNVITSIEEALSAEEGSNVCLEGEVVDIYQEYNSEHDNISVYIEDSNRSKILAFRMTGNVNLHDKIIVTGSIDKHEGINQIGQGATFEDTNEDGNHRYSEATCLEGSVCTICGVQGTAALGHTQANAEGNCDRCGVNIAEAESTKTLTFIPKNENYTNGGEVTSYVKDTITISFEKGSNSNTTKYYTSGEALRAYGGNTISISNSSGIITKIEFGFGTGDSSNKITTETGIFDETTWNGSSESVTFTIGGTTGNRRIASIKVNYINNTSSEEEHVHDWNTDGTCKGENCEAICAHETWIDQTSTSSICNICGYTCSHTLTPGSKCDICGFTQPNDSIGEEKEISLDFSSAAQRTSYSTDEQIWENEIVKLTNNKASSTSNIGDFSKPARFYKSSTLTIECKTMWKIEFFCTSTAYATALNNSEFNCGTISVSENIVTVEFNNAVDSLFIKLDSGQVRMNSLTVTYLA